MSDESLDPTKPPSVDPTQEVKIAAVMSVLETDRRDIVAGELPSGTYLRCTADEPISIYVGPVRSTVKNWYINIVQAGRGKILLLQDYDTTISPNNKTISTHGVQDVIRLVKTGWSSFDALVIKWGGIVLSDVNNSGGLENMRAFWVPTNESRALSDSAHFTHGSYVRFTAGEPSTCRLFPETSRPLGFCFRLVQATGNSVEVVPETGVKINKPSGMSFKTLGLFDYLELIKVANNEYDMNSFSYGLGLTNQNNGSGGMVEPTIPKTETSTEAYKAVHFNNGFQNYYETNKDTGLRVAVEQELTIGVLFQPNAYPGSGYVFFYGTTRESYSSWHLGFRVIDGVPDLMTAGGRSPNNNRLWNIGSKTAVVQDQWQLGILRLKNGVVDLIRLNQGSAITQYNSITLTDFAIGAGQEDNFLDGGQIRIGNSFRDDDSYYVGDICQAFICKKALTDAEINSLSQGATIDQLVQPEHWWKLSGAVDRGDYGNKPVNLTLTGTLQDATAPNNLPINTKPWSGEETAEDTTTGGNTGNIGNTGSGTVTPPVTNTSQTSLNPEDYYHKPPFSIPERLAEQVAINDYTPPANRTIPARSPVNPYKYYTPTAFTGSALPTIDVYVAVHGGPALSLTNVPVGVTPLKNSSGQAHRNLAVCRYDDCVTIENCWHDSNGEYIADIDCRVGGTSVYKENNVILWRWTRTRPIRNAQPQHAFHQINPAARPALDFTWSNKLNSNGYYTQAINDTGGLNGLGLSSTRDMGTTGGRDDIGWLPGWASFYLFNPNNETASTARADADSAASCQMHIRDRATKLPLKLTDHPGFSTDYRTLQYGDNPAVDFSEMVDKLPAGTQEAFGAESAHLTGFAIVAALATGSDYDRETCEFFANVGAGITWIPGYRGYEKGYLTDSQCRSIAWCLRSLAYGTVVARDSMRPYFDQLMQNNRVLYDGKFGKQGNMRNAIHVHPSAEHSPDGYNNGRAISPWQLDYVSTVLSQVITLGFTDWVDVRDYFVTGQVQRMTEICYQYATPYSITVRPVSNDPNVPNRDMPVIARNYVDVLQMGAAENSSFPGEGQTCGLITLQDDGRNLKQGDIAGYPSSAYGYPAWFQPALAGAVDAEIPGADAAWQVFMTKRQTYPNYSTNPACAIVPRKYENAPTFDQNVTYSADNRVHVKTRVA